MDVGFYPALVAMKVLIDLFSYFSFICCKLNEVQCRVFKLINTLIALHSGMFNGGKYHGYGTLEIQNQNGTYEGSFKNGQQNGHGVLINDYITYIGEFSNGQQNGFGVLDNSHTGEKYMGMFVDNKRSGHGFCITVEGQYFEGQFIDDELCGSGVAVFTDESYYEGDLTMHGPNGRGTLYLPRESVKTEVSCVQYIICMKYI